MQDQPINVTVGSELTPPKLPVPRLGYLTANSNEHQHLPILGEIWKILFTLKKQKTKEWSDWPLFEDKF